MLKVDKSTIHGIGLFAIIDIPTGTPIDPVVSGSPGFNHSCDNNVTMERSLHKYRDQWCLYVDAIYTNRPIKAGEELTVDYKELGFVCNCPRCQKP